MIKIFLFAMILITAQAKEYPDHIKKIHKICIEKTIIKYKKMKGCTDYAAIHIAYHQCNKLIKAIAK